MKVFLLGATGGTGFEILKILLQEGHSVKVLLRTPSKLQEEALQNNEKNLLEIVKGSVFDQEVLTNALSDCDLVVSALGTGKGNKYTEIYSVGGRNILKAMRTNNLKRLITITSGLIDLSDPGTDNFFLNRIIRPNYNKVYYDQTRWETVLDDTTDIDWTAVRPTNLNNKKFTGSYRVKEKHCPKGGWKISRADVADFIVKEMRNNAFIHKKPVISY